MTRFSSGISWVVLRWTVTPRILRERTFTPQSRQFGHFMLVIVTLYVLVSVVRSELVGLLWRWPVYVSLQVHFLTCIVVTSPVHGCSLQQIPASNLWLHAVQLHNSGWICTVCILVVFFDILNSSPVSCPRTTIGCFILKYAVVYEMWRVSTD